MALVEKIRAISPPGYKYFSPSRFLLLFFLPPPHSSLPSSPNSSSTHLSSISCIWWIISYVFSIIMMIIIIMGCSCLHDGSWASRPRPSSRKSCLVSSFSCFPFRFISCLLCLFLLTRRHPHNTSTHQHVPSTLTPHPTPMSSLPSSHHTLTRLVVFHLICLHSCNLC